jgi:serine phosphatase RsbU (regulator of sigma subunit)
MTRLASFWHNLTEGHSLGDLWGDFRREARSSFESSVAELSSGARERRGWRRVWAFARAMFFRLTPARRVVLLLALLLLLSSRTSFGGPPNDDPSGRLFLAALCLLALLALEVADRVALKRDLEVAREIQNWLLPHSPPHLAGLDIAFATRPANTVAGDYYDVLSLPASGASPAVLFVVADVAGKGIPAGLLMACFRSCLHTLTDTARELPDLIARLHSFCCANSYGGRRFTTAFLAQYDAATGSILYVNAGHNPPLLRRASGPIVQLDAGGVPFGVFANATHEIGQLSVCPGDLLLIYTDGAVEAVSETGEEYGLDRLRTFVRDTVSSAAGFQQQLFASIDAFTGKASQQDDITCLVVQFRG